MEIVFLLGMFVGAIFGAALLIVYSLESTASLPEDLKREFDSLALKAASRYDEDKRGPGH